MAEKLISTGKVVAICISPKAGDPMQSVLEAEAIQGAGIKGDRYCDGIGSFNVKRGGKSISTRAHAQASLVGNPASRKHSLTAVPSLPMFREVID